MKPGQAIIMEVIGSTCYNCLTMATYKQKLAVKHIIEGDSISKAMLKAGYSPATAKNPKNLTERIVFSEFMEKHGVTDDKVAERLSEGLDATKTIVMGKDSNESFVDIQPDYLVRHKYIDTTLRLKGYLKNNEGTTNNVINIPILGGISVHNNTGDDKTSETPETP